jgi:hypothetical protein
MLVGSKHKATVGEVEAKHNAEVRGRRADGAATTVIQRPDLTPTPPPKPHPSPNPTPHRQGVRPHLGAARRRQRRARRARGAGRGAAAQRLRAQRGALPDGNQGGGPGPPGPAGARRNASTASAAADPSAGHPGSPARFAPCPLSHPPPAPQFEWRNGWFYGLTQAVLAAGKPDPCPKHTALLKEVGAV